MKKEETIKNLVRKAERSLEVARALFLRGDYDFSVSRAYYAMFYCAEALLFSKDLSFSKHAAVISAFGKEFVKTGIFPKEYSKFLREAFDDRLTGDYTVTGIITKEKCEKTLNNAKKFIRTTKEYLKITD